MAKPQTVETASLNIINKNTIIKGDITCSGDIRIEGRIDGNLISQSKVVIGKDGRIDGTLNCSNADISGTVNAEVSIKEMLQLRACSYLVGNIKVGKLSVEPGAHLSGKCSMNVSDLSSVEKKDK